MAKCRAVIKQNYIDDIELDEEGVAEMLMDENALASMPRYQLCFDNSCALLPHNVLYYCFYIQARYFFEHAAVWS